MVEDGGGESSTTSTNVHQPPKPRAHAEGGTRTPTGLRPLAPEASASTNSTTSARERNGESKARYNPKSTLGLTASPAVSILRWPEWTKHQSPATRGRDMTNNLWIPRRT